MTSRSTLSGSAPAICRRCQRRVDLLPTGEKLPKRFDFVVEHGDLTGQLLYLIVVDSEHLLDSLELVSGPFVALPANPGLLE